MKEHSTIKKIATGPFETQLNRIRVRRSRLAAICRFFLIWLCLLGSPAAADWINLGGAEVAPNIAEIHVQDTGVKVVLEIFIEEIATFLDLVPGEWLDSTGRTPVPDSTRLARFAREGLSIRIGDGVPLPVEALVVEQRLRVDRASLLAGQTDPYSGRMMPKPPPDPRVLYAELFYPFGATRPDKLSIVPPMREDGTLLATIGMIAFHDAVPVIDFRFLSAAATLKLDWEDSWYTRFESSNLTRHHKYPRMTFLYADPHEVRHEALVRVRDAMALVGWEADGATLDAEGARALGDLTAAELGRRTPMTIDAAEVKADFDRAAFMRIGLRGLEFLQPGEPINIKSDILGLIWSVPTDGLPKQATLEWTWFDARTPEVAGYAVDAAGPFVFPLVPEDSVVTWTNHFKTNPYPEVTAVAVIRDGAHPTIMIVLCAIAALGLGFAALQMLRGGAGDRRIALIGAGLAVVAVVTLPVVLQRQSARILDLDQDKLSTLAGEVLNNVYRAFDFRTEDQVYDRLALTLEGVVLEQVYLGQRNSLRIERAGGAEARVDALEIRAVGQLEAIEPGTLRLRADWVVRGTVGHWGHVHSRTNAYEAELVLVPVDGSWKIRDFDLISQERLS